MLSKKKSDWMRLVELSEQQWRQMKILLRMKRNLPHLFDESAEMRWNQLRGLATSHKRVNLGSVAPPHTK
jgi:hypothetical protein